MVGRNLSNVDNLMSLIYLYLSNSWLRDKRLGKIKYCKRYRAIVQKLEIGVLPTIIIVCWSRQHFFPLFVSLLSIQNISVDGEFVRH